MDSLTIGFVRRGYSASGGAEAYLKRLARGVAEAGHAAKLITTGEWPPDAWPFGEIQRVAGASPRAFADQLVAAGAIDHCDVVMSLERIWRCDVFRAGDGVHAAWLERRARYTGSIANALRRWSRKHRDLLALERSLLGEQCADRVIANSQMVKTEIRRFYGFPADKIDVVYTGVPTAEYAQARQHRDRARAELNLAKNELAVLFAGSGWERKGLRFAIRSVERLGTGARLLVAGRGDPARFRSAQVQFIGERRDLVPLYGAADIFLLPTIYDPFSNACLEALAAGLPVVTTSANGFAEIIDNGVHGSIVADADEIGALADALDYWRDADRRQNARTINLQHAAQFDIATNVARTLEILLQLAARADSTSGKMRKT